MNRLNVLAVLHQEIENLKQAQFSNVSDSISNDLASVLQAKKEALSIGLLKEDFSSIDGLLDKIQKTQFKLNEWKGTYKLDSEVFGTCI